MTKTYIVGITLLCLALSSNLQAQAGGDIESQIKQLQQEATKAQMNGDVSWAQQHLADGFIAGHSWGQWQDKNEFIKDLQDKKNKWKSGDISDVHVATFGANTAVAHYKFAYDAEISGKALTVGGGLEHAFSRTMSLDAGVDVGFGKFDHLKAGDDQVTQNVSATRSIRMRLGVTWRPGARGTT